MKHQYRLLPLLVVAGIVLSATPGISNLAPLTRWSAPYSGTVSPKSPHPGIRMESEEVTIRLKARTYTVDGVYHFFNTGETVTPWVGFPKQGAEYAVRRYVTPEFLRFDAWVNGKKVEFSEEPDPSRGRTHTWRAGSRKTLGYSRWVKSEVTFPGHEKTTMRVRYEVNYSTDSHIAYYIYGTGLYWKDRIGTARFIIDGTDKGGVDRFQVDFFHLDTQKHVIRRNPISDNVVMFEVRDFEPDYRGSLKIELRSSSDDGRRGSLARFDHQRDDWKGNTMTGKVVGYSSKRLSLLVPAHDGPKVMNVALGVMTRFIPMRKALLGETVKVAYREENGATYGYYVWKVPPEDADHHVAPRYGQMGSRLERIFDDHIGNAATLVGKVVGSNPRSLSLEAESEGFTTVMDVRVGLKTKFIPFRRPVVGETVQVKYQDKDGKKYAFRVKVIRPLARLADSQEEAGRTVHESAYGTRISSWSSKTVAGEVVESSHKEMSIQVAKDREASDIVSVSVGLKTNFIPFRRPAVGEKVEVQYREENGGNFAYKVKVIQ